MTDPGAPRSLEARNRVLIALMRVFEGLSSSFVDKVRVIGGLVPEALVIDGAPAHQGTADADLQLDLVLADGSSARFLEEGLLREGFSPTGVGGWRWSGPGSLKVEFLCDQPDLAYERPHRLADCEEISAMNLAGTGFAARAAPLDRAILIVDGKPVDCPIPFAGLAGYVMAKAAAATHRGLDRDYFDLAYVLIWNKWGGAVPAALEVAGQLQDDHEAVLTCVRRIAEKYRDIGGVAARALPSGLAAHSSDADELAGMAMAAVDAFVRSTIEEMDGS